VLRVQGWRLIGRRGERVDFALSVILVAVVTAAVFAQSTYPALFLVLPPLLLVAYRHGFAGAALSTALICLIATAFTLGNHGPFDLITNSDLAQRSLLLQFFIATACVTGLPVAFAMTEQRRLALRVRESELRYRVLAEHSRDLVVRIRPDGRRTYVSPSSREILGWEPEELLVPRWELVHPDDRAALSATMGALMRDGGSTTVTYRAMHRDGHYVWIEANAVRVQAADGQYDIIYAGRDVSRRVQVEQELAYKERQLRAITDNMPAMISRLDREERYVFASENVGRLFGQDPTSFIGRTMREVRGEAYYALISEYTAAALRGERVSFEFEAEVVDGSRRCFRAEFIPDVDPAGDIVGFYAMGVDITAIKEAERELVRLARQDSLTGLANRRHFNERLELAMERAKRNQSALALMFMDVDRFKQINDGLGHATGDAVLREFAVRLQNCVRNVDMVARLGGDEFVVLLEDVDSPRVPEQIAERLVGLMQTPLRVDQHEVVFSTSIGIGYCHLPLYADALLQLADTALYAAKDAGRATWRLRSDDSDLTASILAARS
jgi:diguanylate cyclase (GGDEF)-like protein/PAS domain S-box-containing protein